MLKMDLRITFEPNISEPSGSRLVLSVGDALARSYPMSAEDHYRDLVALKYFLGKRTLSSILLGDEPVAAVEYLPEGDLVLLRPYRRLGERLVSGEFSLTQGLSHIGYILEELMAVITPDRALLDKQVAEDISAGVYDVCLNTGHAID